MTEAYATLNGQRLTRVALHMPNVGPWFADCDFEDAPDVDGAVTLVLGNRTFRGTVVSQYAGTFGQQRKVRIIGGGAGWGNILPAKSYHNDAGIKARLVAEDCAREAGETLGTFEPEVEKIGVDYVRNQGPASRSLQDVIGNAPWYVDAAGVTHVSLRPEIEASDADYDVLTFDPRTRVGTLSVDDPGAIQIGTILTKDVDEPITVRELEVRVDADALTVAVWCGGSAFESSRLAELMRQIALRVGDGVLYGKYRYRVIDMAIDGRVELQAVRKGAGLPDVRLVSMWPGIPGAHSELTPGAEVLVEFVEGDRAQPIVTHFAGINGAGFVPLELILGGGTGAPAARSGDAVEVLLPPAVFTGTIAGSPASGVMTFTLNKTSGIITTGSSKVKVAT